jgi:hypothetical protein
MESNPEVQAFVAELILTGVGAAKPTPSPTMSSFKENLGHYYNSRGHIQLIDFETKQYIGEAEYVGPVGKEFVITWVKPTKGIYDQRLEPRFANTYFTPAVPGTNWFMWSGGEKWWVKDN